MDLSIGAVVNPGGPSRMSKAFAAIRTPVIEAIFLSIRRRVPRWIPGFRPFDKAKSAA